MTRSDILTTVPLEGILSVGIPVGVFAAVASNRVSVDATMFPGMLLLILIGAVEPALAGFAHPAVISIAALFVFTAGIRETGATQAAAPIQLGRPRSIAAAQFRLMAPVTLLSAFINNTPVVAMYLPLARSWAERIGVSPSKLLLPLSYRSMLGGQLTLIGGASNLIVTGLYVEYLREAGLPALSYGMRFWGPAFVRLPALVGIAYLVVVAPKLLPARLSARNDLRQARPYTVQLDVLPGSSVAGATIESAGLRHLPGLFLFQIERGGAVTPAPPPDTRLAEGDRLEFTGILESVVILQRFRGLAPAQRLDSGPVAEPAKRELVEAVIDAGPPLSSQTVRDTRFRTVYSAAIVAVHRKGSAIHAKIGDIQVEASDTIVLEAPRHDRMRRTAAILTFLVIGLIFAPLDPVVVCMSPAVLMICCRCLTAAKALSSIFLPVVVSIGSALGIGVALEQAGTAAVIASWLLNASQRIGAGKRGMLFAMIVTATACSQVLTKNGAAALLFPIAKATAKELGVHPEPFEFSLILACGLSFLSPLAYQTNLMMSGPGGYRFLAFPKVGAPLTLILAVLCALICPLAFPFRSGP